MIVAVERTKFTYLYKYNQIRVDISQVIDKPSNVLKNMLNNDFNGLIQIFNLAIPIFEQDHEIILLEIDKSKISVQNGIFISFDSIICIYPLTKTGKQLLEGKINDDFIVDIPVFEKCIEALRIIRSMKFRITASEKLLAHFNLGELLNKGILSAIEASVKKSLLEKTQPQEFNTFLDHLIAYNKTPSYIPDGNIEYLCKIGAVAIKHLGKPEEVFTNGPFYKSCLKYKNQINTKSYYSSYKSFLAIPDESYKDSYKKIVEIISKDFDSVDIFQISYFFLAIKAYLNKNDNKLHNLEMEIQELKESNERVAAFVLALIGYTFSFEQLYESIHILNNVPLLKTSHKHAQKLTKENPTLKEDSHEDSKAKSEDDFHEDVKQQIAEQKIEKDISEFKEITNDVGEPELKDTFKEEYRLENSVGITVQEDRENIIEQTKVNDKQISAEKKPKRQSKGKEKIITKNIATQVVNKLEVKSDQPFDPVTIGTQVDLFRQPNSGSFEKINFYCNDELIEIVRIVEETNVFIEDTYLKAFKDVIMNKSTKGIQKEQILIEIEILRKDLCLSLEVTDKLKSIILKLKE